MLGHLFMVEKAFKNYLKEDTFFAAYLSQRQSLTKTTTFFVVKQLWSNWIIITINNRALLWGCVWCVVASSGKATSSLSLWLSSFTSPSRRPTLLLSSSTWASSRAFSPWSSAHKTLGRRGRADLVWFEWLSRWAASTADRQRLRVHLGQQTWAHLLRTRSAISSFVLPPSNYWNLYSLDLQTVFKMG